MYIWAFIQRAKARTRATHNKSTQNISCIHSAQSTHSTNRSDVHTASVIVYNICMCTYVATERSKHWEHDGKVKLQGPWLCTLYLSMYTCFDVSIRIAYGVYVCSIYEKLNKTDPVLPVILFWIYMYFNFIQPYLPPPPFPLFFR